MRPVDFSKLVNRLRENSVGKEDVAIWGGRCAADEVETFLVSNHWAAMPYRIWEWTDRIVFVRDEPPDHVFFLERGRLFGPGGDLAVWRDGDTFRWRYVGLHGVPVFEEWNQQGRAKNFWDQEPEARYHRYRETALLWGRWDGQRRRDTRVAGADLRYPAWGERVCLDYNVFSREGRVEFVQFIGLRAWGVSEGGQRLD